MRLNPHTPICGSSLPYMRQSQAVLDQAVVLRQQRKMSLGDALVAGTALAHGLTLVTRNVEDFQWIRGLSLLNPFESEPPQEHTPQS